MITSTPKAVNKIARVPKKNPSIKDRKKGSISKIIDRKRAAKI